MNRRITTLSEKITKLLNEQVSHELVNYLLYRKFASVCALYGLDLGEKYYLFRAAEEIRHAQMIQHYLRLNDAPVEALDLKVPEMDLGEDEVYMTFEHTITREIDTTEKLINIYEVACEEKNYMVQHWLQEGLLKIQQEDEEPESRTALDIMKTDDGLLRRIENVYNLVKDDIKNLDDYNDIKNLDDYDAIPEI